MRSGLFDAPDTTPRPRPSGRGTFDHCARAERTADWNRTEPGEAAMRYEITEHQPTWRSRSMTPPDGHRSCSSRCRSVRRALRLPNRPVRPARWDGCERRRRRGDSAAAKIERNNRNTLRTSRKIDAARGGADVLSAAQPLEVECRQPGEDHETGDCVDERAVRDLHEHEHDPEHDQRDPRPEEEAGEDREVAPRRVADGTEPGHLTAPPSARQTACGSSPTW